MDNWYDQSDLSTVLTEQKNTTIRRIAVNTITNSSPNVTKDIRSPLPEPKNYVSPWNITLVQDTLSFKNIPIDKKN